MWIFNFSLKLFTLYNKKFNYFTNTLTETFIKTPNKKSGIKEIARRANVSIGTVDRAIHNREGVSQETKERILKIIKELNYQPNLLARRLASKKVYQLAVLVPEATDETSYWNGPLNGIEKANQEIEQYGVEISRYCFNLYDKESFKNKAAEVLSDKIDGLLLAPIFPEESAILIDECKKLQIPYVFIDSNLNDNDNLTYIGLDSYKSGYLAGKLINYGVPQDSTVMIVTIAREMDNHYHFLKREEGFRAYFTEKGISAIKLVKVDSDVDDESVKRSLETSISQNPNTKAIFVTNSRVHKVARYLDHAGKSGIRVIGYDLIKPNVEYLKKDYIDFLISQKPEEQGYQGIMTLYNYLLMKSEVNKINFMPIDIVTKENIDYYR